MTKPAHTRLTWYGHLGASSSNVQERWSFSLNSIDDAAVSGADEATLIAKATAMDSAAVTHLRAKFGANCFFDGTTIASIDADGKYRVRADGSYVKGEYSGVYAGTMAKQPMPAQTALCVSLVTERSGPTGKGRFFLPWPALSLDVDTLLIPYEQLTPIVTSVASFLGAVNDIPGINLAVVSSKGYTSDIKSIKIGHVPDTMRSRREDLPEGYQFALVPQ